MIIVIPKPLPSRETVPTDRISTDRRRLRRYFPEGVTIWPEEATYKSLRHQQMKNHKTLAQTAPDTTAFPTSYQKLLKSLKSLKALIMPPRSTHQTSLPEGDGVTYDESDMALFRAKLAYHSTIEERMASRDNNLVSIAEHQGRLLKRWDMLKVLEKEMAEKGKSLEPAERQQLAQYAWRFKRLENLATQNAS
ncbi:hypothetical protein G4B11_001486 [Aspergillus flavus]|nr:hypothetical protein G4B11_001486 [Aspergillus flavus]